MVLMRMSQHQPNNPIFDRLQCTDVWRNDLDPGCRLVTEHHAQIHQQELPAKGVQIQIHADLAGTPDGQEI